ncbi:MAG: hypothetical protein LBC75_11465 [Fibromonadaceae bacterium]|jgi:hypothetical protein|nr:hypothetical protein [Fibromonadaceae bacterium]
MGVTKIEDMDPNTPLYSSGMDIKKYQKYEKITERQINNMAEGLKSYLKNDNFREIFTVDFKEVSFREETLLEIIELVWKRKIYFQVFHDLKDLNELKEASLYCFWILKLQPFEWLKENYQLNVLIALNIFIGGLCLYVKEKENKEINFPEDVLKNLYYSFRYRDWSKEALMDLAESLASTMLLLLPSKEENRVFRK